MHRPIIETQPETFLLVFRYPYRENTSGFLPPPNLGLIDGSTLVFETDDASDARFFAHIRSCIPDFKHFIVLAIKESDTDIMPENWRQLAGLLACFPQKTFLVAEKNCQVGSKCTAILDKNHVFLAENAESIPAVLKNCLEGFNETTKN